MLAYYFYPFENNQESREYTEKELMNPQVVKEVKVNKFV